MKVRSLYILLISVATAAAQPRVATDSILNDRVLSSALVNSSLLPLETSRSAEYLSLGKTVLAEDRLDGQWRLAGAHPSGVRAVGSPSDPDYATYGSMTLSIPLGGRSLEAFNRLYMVITPDCDGSRAVNLNFSFKNAAVPKPGFNEAPGNHLLDLRNHQANVCILEIADLQRDRVESLDFDVTFKGRDLTTGDSLRYVISDIRFQKIEAPSPVSGWSPSGISLPSTGYMAGSAKTAVLPSSEKENFRITGPTGTVFEAPIQHVKTTTGKFGVADFSSFDSPGIYTIETDNYTSFPFRIGERLWEDSQWRVVNYIYGQRCGFAVPGVHGTCHTDLLCEHDGVSLSFGGGWHDAGDLSQQSLQTADVAFNLLEASEAVRGSNPALSARLREEALWGLDFELRTRFGDGWRATSMGLLIWQDGRFGTLDDIVSVRKNNYAFDNYLHAAYEAAAATKLDTDPELAAFLRRAAIEDFSFAEEKFARDGFDVFVQPYEHTYNTSRSQFMATVSWTASQLYALTGEPEYAQRAAEAIGYVLECQRTQPLGDGTRGFFYRDADRRSVVHYIHQSREQVYAMALVALCRLQPEHPDAAKWRQAALLYGDYLKGLMQYTAPYGMISSGVYNDSEWRDEDNFYALHLFPPEDAPSRFSAQIRHGVQIDAHHYVRRFPVWFNIFNGNAAIMLSTGKAAAVLGNFFGDEELLQIGREQLYWMVGKNPFRQSLIYGEGWNYPSMDSFSSGELTGEMPVGIRSLGDTDEPYWPNVNNACYKEVWVTVAGKWMSLVAEF